MSWDPAAGHPADEDRCAHSQRREFGQVGEGVVGQDGNLVVTQVQTRQRAQVAQTIPLNRLDLVDVQIPAEGKMKTEDELGARFKTRFT
jgi:hypothetical protein